MARVNVQPNLEPNKGYVDIPSVDVPKVDVPTPEAPKPEVPAPPVPETPSPAPRPSQLIEQRQQEAPQQQERKQLFKAGQKIEEGPRQEKPQRKTLFQKGQRIEEGQQAATPEPLKQAPPRASEVAAPEPEPAQDQEASKPSRPASILAENRGGLVPVQNLVQRSEQPQIATVDLQSKHESDAKREAEKQKPVVTQTMPDDKKVPESAADNDPLTLVDEEKAVPKPPKSTPNVARSKAFQYEKDKKKREIRNVGKRAGRGNSVFGPIVSDYNTSISEVSFGHKLLLGAIRHPESMLRELVTAIVPEADMEKVAVDDSYAVSVLDDLFNNHPVSLLITKHPVPDEASSHQRIVRMHMGPEVRMHPLAAKMFNADQDGDTANVSFDAKEAVGAKSAMDFLVGTDNEVKIDDDFFAMRMWGSPDYVSTVLRQLFDYQGLDDVSVKGLSNAIIACSNKEKGAYKSLVRWIRSAAQRQFPENKTAQDMTTANMLDSIFRLNHELWCLDAYVNLENRAYQKPEASEDTGVYNPVWDADLNDATMPPNFHDLIVAERNPVSPVAKKNVHFRAGAALGKRIKPLANIVVGNRRWKNPNQSRDWLKDADEIMSKRLSSSISLGERRFSYASYMRARVVAAAGTPASPNYNGDIVEFAKQFARTYNMYQTIVDMSNIVVRTDGSIEHLSSSLNPIKGWSNNEDIRGAFKQIYGDFTMRSIFGDHPRIRGHEDQTLNDFIDSYRGAALGGKTKLYDTGAFIKALQDQRFGRCKNFSNDFEKTLGDFFDNGKNRLQTALRSASDQKRDFTVELDTLIEAMHLLGADVFHAMGISSAADFRDSNIGNRMMHAKDADQLGGLVYEAVGRYRLDLAMKHYERGDWQRFNEELDATASISDTWNALVSDFRSGGTAINDIVLNQTIGRKAKDYLLSELVKSMPHLTNFKFEYEIALELMNNPRGLYAGPKTTADYRNTMLDNFKAASRKITASAKESYKECHDQVVQTRNYAKEVPGLLDGYLSRVASGEVMLFSVPRKAFADALEASLEPTFKSSEKSTQELGPAGLYSIMTTAKNGRAWSDLAIADDVFLGAMPLDRFCSTPLILANILADPTLSVKVYDSRGEIEVSRESLTGGTDEASLWEYLDKNPRVAMALRHHSVSLFDDSPYVSATDTLFYSIQKSYDDPNDRAFMKLADHPGFAGAVSLLVPAKGRKVTQGRNQRMNAIEDMIKAIRIISQIEGDLNVVTAELVAGVLPDNPNEDQLAVADHLAANLARYAYEVKEMRLPRIDEHVDIDFLFDDESALWGYFNVVQMLSGSKTEMSTGINGAESQRNAVLAFYASYVPDDCGATEMLSLPVDEFSQTWEKYERRQTDGGVPIDETTWERIVAEADSGVVRIEVPEACQHPSGCPCKRHRMFDPSTNVDPSTQTTPLGRYMLDKRTAGSESLNLKIKTLGDDKTDSIAKFDVIGELKERKWLEVRAAVIDAYDNFGIEAARRELAQLLYDRNRTLYSDTLGYDSLNVDDFANVAQAMIRFDPDDGSIDILSVGQLSMIAKQAAYDLVATVGDPNEREVQNAVVAAIQNWKSQTLEDQAAHDSMLDDIGAMMKVSSQRTEPIAYTDEHRSSKARNAQLVERLYMNLPIAANERLNGAKKEKAKAYYLNKAIKNSSSRWMHTRLDSNGYDVLGIVGKDGADVSMLPGHSTVWLVTNEASRTDVVTAIKLAEASGATIAFHDPSDEVLDAVIETNMADQIVVREDGISTIPFFDIILNGPATTGEEGAFNIGVYKISPDEVVRIVEDTSNHFALSDSDVQTTRQFSNRVVAKKTGNYELNVKDAFAGLVDATGVQTPFVDFPSKVEVQAYVVNRMSMYNDGIFIDIGRKVDENSAKSTDDAIQRYVERFAETDEDGWLSDVGPEEIVGWMRGTAGDVQAWHPVRMYDVIQQKSYPAERFQIEGHAYDAHQDALASAKLIVKWKYEEALDGNVAKMFEHWFPANKLMTRANPVDDVELENGHPVDAFVASASTHGRRLTYLKHQSMCTLFAEARLTGSGYNFADADGSMPGDLELKEKLRTGAARLGDWKARLQQGPVSFWPEASKDKAEMDAFMNMVAENAIKAGVNPSDAFASHYEGVPTYHWFRFNVLLDDADGTPDRLMRMFHYMDPTLCPYGREGDSDGTLFDGELRMLVPYRTDDGEVRAQWQHVFTGLHFFDEHFSGFSYPGRHATASKSTVTDNTLLFGGKRVTAAKLRDYLGWAMMDQPSPVEMSNMWLGLDALDDEEN